MKAAIYPGAGQPMVVGQLPDPVPGPDEVLIRVHRCGICGTDLHMTEGHAFQFPAGTVPGHEYAGEVIALGKNVAGWRVGDRLTALPSTGCGHCAACARGNLVLCSNAPGVMGGFADYMRVPAAVAIRLPATLSLADGALIEPLAVARYGLRQSDIGPSSRVLILGGGSVALCAIWWARRMGAARIAAASRSRHRADMALAMGADAFVPFGEGEEQHVADHLGGAPDIVIECVGLPDFLGRAIRHVGQFGQVISLGFCTAPDAIVPAIAARKAVTMRFPVGYTLSDFEHVAREMDKGHADPKMLISSEIGLPELPAMFDALRGPNRETKVHVRLGREEG